MLFKDPDCYYAVKQIMNFYLKHFIGDTITLTIDFPLGSRLII